MSWRKAPGAITSIELPKARRFDWMNTVMGAAFGPAKIRATSRSFHTHMNWKMASAAMAGRASGITSRKKILNSLAPSMRAASSSS